MHRVIICAFCLGITAAAADLPLIFEPNRGQSRPGVEFLSRGNGVTSSLTGSRAELAIGDSTVRMELIGAAPGKGEGLDKLPGLSSYFSGNEPSQWRTGIPQFGRVRYRNVYPGVDLLYYGNHGKLEYDFVIAPGARASLIQLTYQGVDRVSLDRNGNLVLKTASGEIRQRRPVVFQETNGKRTQIAASYRLSRGNHVSFAVGRFDARLPLIVDPVLEYATFFGGGWAGPGEGSRMPGLQADAAGNVYMAGTVTPTSATPSGFANVVKFSPSQNQILYWATYAIGSGPQNVQLPNSLAVDAQGYAYICGGTQRDNIPTVNAYQPHNNGGSAGNAYLAKFAPDGQSLVYSTYLGGSNWASLSGIAVDASGNAFVTGSTQAYDFPVLNAAQSTNKTKSGSYAYGMQSVLAKFSPTGSLLFSTYWGGSGGSSGSAVVLDSAGAPVLIGSAVAQVGAADFPTTPNAYQTVMPPTECAFVAKFTANGQLVFSTLFGGDLTLSSVGAVDAQNNVYLGGAAMAAGLPAVNALIPTYPGGYNEFIAKLSPDGTRVLSSTYLGGYGTDYLNALAVDPAGNIYAAGTTSSPNFPVKNSLVPYQQHSMPWPVYGFLTKIGPDGQSLAYSTLIGGSQGSTTVEGMSLAPSGAAYVIGLSNEPGLPTANAFQSTLGAADLTTISGASTVYLARINSTAGDTPTPYTPPAGGATLAASPSSMNFSLALNGAASTQTFNLTSSASGTPFDATTSVTPFFQNGGINSTNWLSVKPTSGTAPAQLTVTADPTGMPVGSYTGTVTVTSSSGTPAGVAVFMTVSPFSSATTLSAVPASLAFSVPPGGSSPGQSMVLSASTGAAPIDLQVSTASGGNWLSVTPAGGSTPLQTTVSVGAQGLAAGVYSGSILALSSSGDRLTVPVSLTVTASSVTVAGPVIASVNPATLASNQQNQVVTIKGSGFSSQTAASIALANYEFPAALTPTSFVDGNTLTITVRGLFLFQPGSLGVRLTNPGAAGSAGFAIAVQ